MARALFQVAMEETTGSEAYDVGASEQRFMLLLRQGIRAELEEFRSHLLRDMRSLADVNATPKGSLKKTDSLPKKDIRLTLGNEVLEAGASSPLLGPGKVTLEESPLPSPRSPVGRKAVEDVQVEEPPSPRRKARKGTAQRKSMATRKSMAASGRHPSLDGEGGIDLTSEGDMDDEYVAIAAPLASKLVADEVHELSEDKSDWKKKSLRRIETVMGVVIVFNAVVIGLEIDFRALHPDQSPPLAYHAIDTAFFLLFAVELAFRLYVHGTSFFWMEDFAWNWFDLALVIFQGVDISMTFASTPGEDSHKKNSGVRVLRILRILRLARVTRILRVFRLVDDLRNIMASIGSTLKTLFWTMVLISAMVFITAIAVTQTVVEGLMEDEHRNLKMHSLFGTVGASALTLYKCISGGSQWGDVFDVVMDESLITVGLLLVFYISFSLFALLNVVTATFVEKAFDGAQVDRDEKLAANLVNVFLEKDKSVDDTEISWPDFQKNTGRVEIQQYLKEIDITEEEAEAVFQLLDTDGSGTVSLVELVSGCARLRGSAKAIQLALFMKESTRFHQWVTERFMQFDASLNYMTDTLSG